MQLFLHIGTNKTGSSFLQTMLGRNRPLLLKNKIFFPLARREKDMLAGRITAGNGAQLCMELVKGNGKGAGSFLLELCNDASKAGCQSALISNEKLIRALSHNGALEMMVENAIKAGFDEIKVLAVFREPVDHALSLYQHRAKEGLHSDFNRWLDEDYETIRMLQNFLPQLQKLNSPVAWTFRKYASNPKTMLEILFTDWLKIESPDVKDLPAVNPSLSLSEIRLLQLVRTSNPNMVKLLKWAFDKLPKEHKAEDKILREQLRNTAFSYIDSRREQFDAVNERMPITEKLKLLPEPEPSGLPVSCFTNEQLHAVISAFSQSSNIANKSLEGMYSVLKGIKRKVFPKPRLRDMYNLEP